MSNAYYWRCLVENNKQRISDVLGVPPETPETEEEASELYHRWLDHDEVEQYKNADPKVQLDVIRFLIMRIIGPDGDGKLPLELVQLLIEKYQAEYRKTHTSEVHAC